MKKGINFSFEGNNYDCLLEATDKENIKIEIKESNYPKFTRNINLKEIYEQIRAFSEYSMEEFFSALNELTKDNITMEKSSDKYYLVLSFKVLKKIKHLKLELNEASLSKNDIIQELLKKVLNNTRRIKTIMKELETIKNKNIEEKIKIANDWKEKGNLHVKEGQYKEALDCYTKAIENYQNDPLFYSNRSLMHYILSEFDDALEDAEKAILINPNYAKAYLRKGKALEGKKNNKEAAEAFKLGLEKEKDNKQLIQALEELKLSENFKVSNIKNVEVIENNFGEVHSLLLLKDGRISVGHKNLKDSREKGIDIYGSIHFNLIIFIKGIGPYQTELKNGNLVVGSSYLFSIVKLNKTNYEILQSIETKGEIYETIELYNGVLSNYSHYKIYFYEKKGDK